MGKKTSDLKLQIFTYSKKLVTACYVLTHDLPVDEKTGLIFYIRNAALKAHLTLVEGIFLDKKKVKKKLLRKAKNTFVVIDAAVDVLVDVALVKEEQTTDVIDTISICNQLLAKLLKES